MKAIENEYRKQISQDIPDLWARIEAGVDEYEKTKASETEMTVVKTSVGNRVSDDKVVNINSKRTITTIGKILGAVACIALAATVVFNFGSRTKSETASTMADSAMSETVTYEAAADSCETEAPVMAETAEEANPATNSINSFNADKEQSIKGSSVRESDAVSSEAVMDDAEANDVILHPEAVDKLTVMKVMNCDESTVEKVFEILAKCDVYELDDIQKMELTPLDSSLPIDITYWNEQTELYFMQILNSDNEAHYYIMYAEMVGEELLIKAVYDDTYQEMIYTYDMNN